MPAHLGAGFGVVMWVICLLSHRRLDLALLYSSHSSPHHRVLVEGEEEHEEEEERAEGKEQLGEDPSL